MGLSEYNTNPLFGGYDYWARLMSNPCFQQVWQTPNPNINFRGQSSSAGGSSSAAATRGVTGAQSVEGGIPVIPSAEQGDSSFDWLVPLSLTTVLGGGALYCLKTGQFRKAGKTVQSLLGGKSTETTVKEALGKLTAVKNKNGEMRFMIPGKTTEAMNKAKATTFAEENCISEAISLERQKFNAQTSAIETFTCASTDNNYVIKVENGVISSIKDKDGKEILQALKDAGTGTADAKKLEAFENIFKELKKEKDVDTAILDGVTNIGYKNTNGDDVLRMTMAKYGETPAFQDFTTLQRFRFEDPEMQAFRLSTDEKVFADSKFFKDGRLINGVTVKDFTYDIGGGNIGYFEGRTLVKIKKPDGTILPAESAGYIELSEKYEKDINKLLKRVFEKRDFIPNGATIVTG